MENIAVLGSTGSIGTSGLDVIAKFPDRFKVCALSANANVGLLRKQAKIYKPEAVCIGEISGDKGGWGRIKVYEGETGLLEMLENLKIDTVLVGIVGSSALMPILTVLDKARKMALANKEALVMAGGLIMDKAAKNNVKIVPVDSEHSAIFQCIGSNDKKDLKKIFLTGSGGPLLKVKKSGFRNITVKQAINHPRWKMGKKISVDSATMMNKGLEVIEAAWLFNMEIKNIEILIHPEAVIHSMVEFTDGAVLAQMAACDMRLPIQYALTYPERSRSGIKSPDFSKIKNLTFYKPDFERFPCMDLAYDAGKKGGTFPSALNASNETAVKEFMEGRIKFIDIPKVIDRVLRLHKGVKDPGLLDILEADKWARIKTKEMLRCCR
ncbi:MAG: 1-deoxy-D-xylulose-5-phosphate reductoisomerase [Candidatus Omnitrophica bacterium CG_4_9_14_0_2_um_filter_42_8]|nr:MAG: 1-deoxy-D-xylulose-5-phosphate reductoisomerase [Candidatus Omnitrophica bacterium CG22_combo_CG10-13_8_21_14_all_43_16]PJC48788.1 MAG: 1-deoxy-D-xylulose-5-phosphate reductoisomerase [Candidatus Omnitrophica bacterium CG_4_9_14_0_2_um_filter_42_8]